MSVNTAAATSIQERIDEMNQMILEGKILEAFEKFYAEDVVMSDNRQDVREGKDACREYEKAFVNGLTEFRGAELLNVAVNEEDQVSMCEWFFDFTHKDWGDMTYYQTAVQEWKDGQIVRETFYHA